MEQLEDRRLMSGLSIKFLKHYYGFTAIADKGAGETIAIVDAYNNSFARKNLNTYASIHHLPQGGLHIYNLGSAGNTANSSNWALEEDLDIEVIRAFAPKARIDLVEAQSSSDDDMYNAEQYASQLPGVIAISNSWQGEERAEPAFISTSRSIVYTAAAGDSYGVVGAPSTFPDVISVGATSFINGREVTWNNTGWGYSSLYPTRFTPDVSMFGGSPGFNIIVGATNYREAVEGTSLACPLFTSIVALLDSKRSKEGLNPVNTDQMLSVMYANAETAFSYISPQCGLGSPNVYKLVEDLL